MPYVIQVNEPNGLNKPAYVYKLTYDKEGLEEVKLTNTIENAERYNNFESASVFAKDIFYAKKFKCTPKKLENETNESVSGKERYERGKIGTITYIEQMAETWTERKISPAKIHCLCEVLRYLGRLGAKDDVDTELGKAENYLHRALTGEWLKK